MSGRVFFCQKTRKPLFKKHNTPNNCATSLWPLLSRREVPAIRQRQQAMKKLYAPHPRQRFNWSQ
jgi:hypothetical protein